jgi:type III restriction-modification system enzyme mod
MTEQNLTTHINPKTADLQAVLHAHFADCFSKEGSFDFEKFKAVLQQKEVDFFTESYSLQWLGKQYARLLATDPVTTLLHADEAHNALPENAHSQNLLLKGDNLEVLKHLTNAYYEKVKMIYIDPPYNTGSDGFVYQDDRKFTVPQLAQLAGISEEVAQRILSFTQSKSNSHSAWLTFMYPRLYIARQLLKSDGVIFVSIDDNEVAQLRLLMDEVFGEDNFVAELIWQKKQGGGNDAKYIATEHEYILMYGKNKVYLPHLFEAYNEKYLERYSEEDEIGKYFWDTFKRKSGKQYYPIECPDGSVLEFDQNNNPISWLRSKDRFLEDCKKGEIKFTKIEDKWSVMFKQRLPQGKKPRTILVDKGTSGAATDELLSLFKQNVFETPKPIKLIKYLIEIGSNPNDLILDFFAGSGTTADAVMQLNAEYEGNRCFILVQLPELIDKKKNKTAYEAVLSFPSFVSRNSSLPAEPTIFDITKERLLRAAAKLKAEKNDLFNTKAVDFGFQIYETFPIWDDYEFEAKDFTPSLTLFDETKLIDADLRALLLTWKTYDSIPLTESLAPVDLAGYEGYYGFDKLYLIHRGFTTESLKVLLEMMDNTPDFNPTTIVVFGYHFESAHLRQIAENVKAYANKKSISTDFIIRN